MPKANMQPGYKELVGTFCQMLLKKYGKRITSVALYGSVARGTARKDSDIDMLIIGEDIPDDYDERIRMVVNVKDELEQLPVCQKMVEAGYNPYIQFVFFSKAEAKHTKLMFLDLVEDVVILHDDGFLEWKLNQIRQRMKELGSIRVWLPDGSWYWDLKPDLKPGEVFEI